MSTTAPSRRWLAVPLVALLAAGGAWRVQDSPSPDPTSDLSSGHPTPSVSRAEPPSARTEHGDAAGAPDAATAERIVEATGRIDPIVDTESQDARDARAYRARVLDNIASLELAAEIARQQGHPQRADLMQRRVRGLERRLSEFDAEPGGPATPG